MCLDYPEFKNQVVKEFEELARLAEADEFVDTIDLVQRYVNDSDIDVDMLYIVFAQFIKFYYNEVGIKNLMQ